MTVIAWDGTDLAADKQLSTAWMKATVTKIRRIDRGRQLIGAAGAVHASLAMLEWLEACDQKLVLPAAQNDPDKRARALRIDCKGGIWLYEIGPHPVRIEMPFYAIGSGADFAMAAMRCGKTASEAVEIASIYSESCGNGVDVLRLKP